MDKLIKFLKVFSYFLLTIVFTAGVFLLISRATNDKTHLSEAVVINNDYEFHKEINSLLISFQVVKLHKKLMLNHKFLQE